MYGFHGWVPGFIGDFLDNTLVTISEGSLIWLLFVDYRTSTTRKSHMKKASQFLMAQFSCFMITKFLRIRNTTWKFDICSPQRRANNMGNWLPWSYSYRFLCSWCQSHVCEQAICQQPWKVSSSFISTWWSKSLRKPYGHDNLSTYIENGLAFWNCADLIFFNILSPKNQVQAIWIVGQIHRCASWIWPDFHNRHQWSKKRLVLRSCRQVFFLLLLNLSSQSCYGSSWRMSLLFNIVPQIMIPDSSMIQCRFYK